MEIPAWKAISLEHEVSGDDGFAVFHCIADAMGLLGDLRGVEEHEVRHLLMKIRYQE